MQINEAIKNIKSLNDLKTVVESYGVKLKSEKEQIKGLCPFHSDEVPSFSITDKGDGAFYKCFACGKGGDIVNFIKEIDSLTTLEATKEAYDRLGIKIDFKPSKIDNLINYIETNFKEHYNDKDFKLDDIYIYKDKDEIPVLARIKYKRNDGKKQFSQASIVDTGDYYKLDFKGSKQNLLYNLPKVIDAKSRGKNIFLVEGEKDAESLIKLGFTATTCREVSSINNEMLTPLHGCNLVIIGDNDDTGRRHVQNIRKLLKNKVVTFKELRIKELSDLGEKADISDYIDSLYKKKFSRDNIRQIIKDKVNRTLDENNIYELQQDHNGIYQTIMKEDKDNDKILKTKKYITNFNIIDCEILRNKDTKDQNIKITIESNLGKKDTIEADAREMFLDTKSLKKALGIDYTFKGKNTDLPELVEWMLRYKVNKDIDEYTITGIRTINNKNVLVTNNGILDENGTWNTKVRARNDLHDIDFNDITELSEIEARKLAKNLFKVNTKQNIVNSLGLGVAQLYNSYARASKLDNLPVLQDIGESNSGKTIMMNLLRLIMNNNKPSKPFGSCSPFVITKMLNETYLPVFVDEMKPSKAGVYKVNGWSEHIRAITEGYENEKGRKDQTTITYKYNASLILSGEEQIAETAVINRSNIVWYSRNNFTAEGAEAVNYLLKTEEGQNLLRRFSLTLYRYILSLGKDGFEINYNKIKGIDFDISDERIKNTAIYTILGYTTLVTVFKKLKVDITEYISFDEAIKLVKDNLKENVLSEEATGAKAEYETILELIDRIGLIPQCDYNYTRDKLYIQIDLVSTWDKLSKYIKDNGLDIKLLNRDTFIKMLTKSKYVAGENSKDYYKNIKLKRLDSWDFVQSKYTKDRSVRAYKLKIDELQNLYMPTLAPKEEFEEVEDIKHLKIF